MKTNNKIEADKKWWYFTAGLNNKNQVIYKDVKARMAAKLGYEPTNLTIMVDLMKAYLENDKE